MSNILTELHKIQRGINFNNRMISIYNAFIAEQNLSVEWLEFFEKYNQNDVSPREINLSDIAPVVDALNEHNAITAAMINEVKDLLK